MTYTQDELKAKDVVANFTQYYTEFLIEWLQWAESNPPSIEYEQYPWPDFSTYYGLCENFYQWLRRKEYLGMIHFAWYDYVYPKVSELFRDEGMDQHYPFGEDAYDAHGESGEHNTHPPRLDWVRDFIFRQQRATKNRHPHYNLIMLAISNPYLKFEWWSTVDECWKRFDEDETPEWDENVQYRVLADQPFRSAHPHADVLRRWAEDCTLVVEYYSNARGGWIPLDSPSFIYDAQYRIAGDE